MTDQPFDRAAILARRQAITEGPWHVAISGNGDDLANVEAGHVDVCYEASDADADFIAHAPADIDALLGEVERLERALRNIRMSAARGLVFGSQATPQTPERMIERKEAALKTVLDLCASVGVCGSVLRSEEGGA